jgi:hypothetical protein
LVIERIYPILHIAYWCIRLEKMTGRRMIGMVRELIVIDSLRLNILRSCQHFFMFLQPYFPQNLVSCLAVNLLLTLEFPHSAYLARRQICRSNLFTHKRCEFTT